MPEGTKGEDVMEGAGIVSVTKSLMVKRRGDVIRAPLAPILSVFPSSMN